MFRSLSTDSTLSSRWLKFHRSYLYPEPESAAGRQFTSDLTTMAENELVHSTVDDPAKLASFLTWATGVTGSVELRGGDLSIDQSFGDEKLELEVSLSTRSPILEVTDGVLILFYSCWLSDTSGRLSNYKQESPPKPQVQKPTSFAETPPGLRNTNTAPEVDLVKITASSTPGNFQQNRSLSQSMWNSNTDQKNELQRLPQVENNTSRRVVSVAHQKARQESLEVSHMAPSANKLDEELNMSMTPTQKKILGRTEEIDASKISRTETAMHSGTDSLTKSHVSKLLKAPQSTQNLPSESSVENRPVNHPNVLLKPSPNAREGFAGEKYSTMSFYEARQKEFEMVAESRINDYNTIPDLESPGKVFCFQLDQIWPFPDAAEPISSGQPPTYTSVMEDHNTEGQIAETGLSTGKNMMQPQSKCFQDFGDITSQLVQGTEENGKSQSPYAMMKLN